MKKERKGLFGRLLEFWKEKIGAEEGDSIGFWNGTEHTENRLAERDDGVSWMGEEKKAFWQESTERMREEKEQESSIFAQEKNAFFAAAEEETYVPLQTKEEKEPRILLEDVTGERGERKQARRRTSQLLTGEMFREEGKEGEEETQMGRAFLWSMPEEEGENRRTLPITEEVGQETAAMAEEEQEMPQREAATREEKTAATPLDIEMLMGQITKKLWEERESCGRRLRG